MANSKGPIPYEDLEQQAVNLQPFFEELEVPDKDRIMFAYYHIQAPINSRPEWTWSRFERGIAPHGCYENPSDSKSNYDLELVDHLGRALMPNYAKRASGLNPVLDTLKPLAEDMAEALKTGSLLVVSNHPTIASPLLTGRSAIEALVPGIKDIQHRLYITYGLLPTVFEYDFGELGAVSPVGLATAVGNLAITAAISDSNMQPELKEAQEPLRELYKANIGYLLSQPGNIVVVVLNGQRDITVNEASKKIHYPEGDLEVFVQNGAQLVNIAMYDKLLEDPENIDSLVQMYADPRIRKVTKLLLQRANIFQASTLTPTFDGMTYHAERRNDMKIRAEERAHRLREYAARKLGGKTPRH